MSEHNADYERICGACGVIVGYLVKRQGDLFLRFQPAENCALPIGNEYRCQNCSESATDLAAAQNDCSGAG